MSSFLHFTVTGESPYPKKNGIFEVEISITDVKPSSSEIENKSFSFIWKDNFHLNVKNGLFEETLGSEQKPLPNSIISLTNLWIVVTDQFAPMGSLFEFEVPDSMKTRPTTETSTSKPSTSKSKVGKRVGQPGDKGLTGPEGPPGIQGDKGVPGSQGEKGAKGITGPPGDKGAPGPQGPQGEKGKIGITGPSGDKGAHERAFPADN